MKRKEEESFLRTERSELALTHEKAHVSVEVCDGMINLGIMRVKFFLNFNSLDFG